MGTPTLDYLVISPVKNEEEYIEITLKSMCSQTRKPARWIIVDDNSTDKTSEIVDKYVRENDFIEYVFLSSSTPRGPGSPVVEAFNYGLKSINIDDFEYIVKLDGDLEFKDEYFEGLLSVMDSQKNIGIISGVYEDQRNSKYVTISIPDYHAAGASKVYRKDCLVDINGLLPVKGWDTIDEIKAQVFGWETTHVKDLVFKHLKTEGSGIGTLKTYFMHGHIHYVLGGSKIFFMFKALQRAIVGRPIVIGSLSMVAGYLDSMIKKKQRIADENERRLYNKLLIDRMRSFARHLKVLT